MTNFVLGDAVELGMRLFLEKIAVDAVGPEGDDAWVPAGAFLLPSPASSVFSTSASASSFTSALSPCSPVKARSTR